MKLSDEVIDAQAQAVKRASPMLRSAKVVCLSGEYVCLVRDVSDTGVLLSYLHEVPGEARIILVLGNGRTYPIQRLWEGESQASYRFAAPVDVAEFLHERSPFALRPVRLAIAAAARVVDGSASHGVRLRDLSTHGASFEGAADIAPGRLISFQIEKRAPQLAEIAWRERHEDRADGADRAQGADGAHGAIRHGLQFQIPLTLRDLALTALALQPFGPRAPGTSVPAADGGPAPTHAPAHAPAHHPAAGAADAA